MGTALLYKGDCLLITRSASSGTPPAAATPAIIGAGFSLIHIHLPSLDLLTVHPTYGCLGFLCHRHLDKSKPLGLTAVLVLNDGR